MNRAAVVTVLLASTFIMGCTMVQVHEVTDPNSAPRGIRQYEPAVFLFVDKEKQKSVISVLPNYQRAFDVKPITIFAKQDFKLESDEGVLKTITANQDTTSILGFVKDAAELAAKAAGGLASSRPIDGSFGLASGVYRLCDDGVFKKNC